MWAKPMGRLPARVEPPPTRGPRARARRNHLGTHYHLPILIGHCALCVTSAPEATGARQQRARRRLRMAPGAHACPTAPTRSTPRCCPRPRTHPGNWLLHFIMTYILGFGGAALSSLLIQVGAARA